MVVVLAAGLAGAAAAILGVTLLGMPVLAGLAIWGASGPIAALLGVVAALLGPRASNTSEAVLPHPA